MVENVLRTQLGYGEEFSVTKNADILYDFDEDTHLDKTFEDLGIKPDTFIVVSDDAGDDARVDLVFSVIEKEAAEGAPPISLPEEVVLAKKPKKVASAPETNGNGKIDATMHNGTNGMNGATKRKADDADLGTGEEEMVRKKGKVMEGMPKEEDIVVIEDDGAIVLD